MSAREEQEHGYEAIIKDLTKALTDIKGSLMDSLKPPTFDWNSLEQYENFWLFIKGMESWYTLQGIPDKDSDTTWLEYLLNFLGPIGWRKHEQWNLSGTAAEEWEKNKKSAKLFMEFLHSSMDYPISQWCRIYQQEEIRIKAGETPEELIKWIWGLTNRLTSPQTQRKKGTCNSRWYMPSVAQTWSGSYWLWKSKWLLLRCWLCTTYTFQLQITWLQWAYLLKLLVQYRRWWRNHQHTAPMWQLHKMSHS